MIDIHSKKELDNFMKASKRCVLSFHGMNCTPCKFQERELLQLEKLVDVPILRIDVETNTKLSQEYGVTSIPTTMIVKNSKVQKSLVGLYKFFIIKELLEGV